MSSKNNAPAVCFDTAIINLLPWINDTAQNLTKHKEEAADLAQETILKALEAKNRFNPSLELRPWLLVIMINTHRSQLRRDKRIVFYPCDHIANIGKMGEDNQENKDLIQRIYKFAKINNAVKSALLFAEGYTTREIIKNIPGSTEERTRRRIWEARHIFLPRLVNDEPLRKRSGRPFKKTNFAKGSLIPVMG